MAQFSNFFGRPFPEAEGAFVRVLAGRPTIHHLPLGKWRGSIRRGANIGVNWLE
ncbi:MAG: hypothetical protein P8I39_10315 [Akkermansiaceae bacterium]|nr:hypothetical protein [Akkermansiaceae bacterium]